MNNHDFFLRRVTVSAFMENVYIVGDPDTKECMVVDPGAEGDRVLYEIESNGFTVKLIVNTHGHMDHTGAVATIKEATGAPYGLHPSDLEVLRGSAQNAKNMLPDFRDPPEPDLDLSGGDILEVGKFKFMVVETSGHSPGSVCLVGHGAVFTGDTLFRGSIGRFDTLGGDGRALLDNIVGKLLVLPDDTSVYPGHGPESTIGQERTGNPFLQPGADKYIL